MSTDLTKVSSVGFTELQELAKALVPTGFLPEHIKTPGQAVAIILTGREMGVGPMQALRSIVMVKGKPTVAADLQLALFKNAGGKATFTELTEKRAVLTLTHPNGDKHTETFSMEDADKAGLLQSQPNYRKFPKAMLRSRAITAGLKSIGFEACAGAYDPDELAAVPANPTGEVIVDAVVVEENPVAPIPVQEVGPRLPFGKSKGKLLSELSADTLEGALAWAQEKGKFEDFQADAQAELIRRGQMNEGLGPREPGEE